MNRLLRWLPLLLFVGVVLGALWPALSAGALFSSRYDWRYFESMSEVARRTAAWYHQVPLWNPYSCGGEVDLANPQSLDGAPTFALTLLFGTAWGLKLAMVGYYLLALWGMFALGRRLEMSRTPALLSALCFGLSGYLAMHLAAGHINFASVALFPSLIYCFDRALSPDQDDWRFILPAGALAAWIAVYGGTFTPALCGELLLLWVPVAAARQPDGIDGRWLGRVLALLVALGAIALLVGGYRMVPALEFIIDHPRPLFRRTPDVTLPGRLLWDLFAWRDLGPLPGRKYWSHEYTARLPQVAAPLLFATLGLLFQRSRRGLLTALILAAGMAALLCLGNFSPLAPWSLLQKLPVLRDLRVPSRHLVLLVFMLALLAGLGAEALLALLKRRPWLAQAVGVLLVLLAGADAAVYTNYQFRGVFDVPLVVPPSPPIFFHVQGHWSQMRELIFAGRGVMGCDEEAPLQRARELDLGPQPQARLVDGTAGVIVDSWVSPNLRRVTLDLQRSSTQLLINSNWNEHFRLDRTSRAAGARIVNVDGRLAVDLSALPPGRHEIQVIYAPRSFALGLALSLIAWPLGLLGFFARRIRAWRIDRADRTTDR